MASWFKAMEWLAASRPQGISGCYAFTAALLLRYCCRSTAWILLPESCRAAAADACDRPSLKRRQLVLVLVLVLVLGWSDACDRPSLKRQRYSSAPMQHELLLLLQEKLNLSPGSASDAIF